MKIRSRIGCLAVLAVTGLICSCGGGGGGGGSASLSPPAFTNLAGTRWTHKDTAQAGVTCPGIVAGVTSDTYIMHVLNQSGNTLSVYDETHTTAANAKNATISGFVVTYVGERNPIGGCSSMSANYTMILNGAGTSYAGTGVITCNDAPACTVPITITGTKLP